MGDWGTGDWGTGGLGDWGTGGGAIAWCVVTSSVKNLLGSRRAWSKSNNCINENMDLFRLILDHLFIVF